MLEMPQLHEVVLRLPHFQEELLLLSEKSVIDAGSGSAGVVSVKLRFYLVAPLHLLDVDQLIVVPSILRFLAQDSLAKNLWQRLLALRQSILQLQAVFGLAVTAPWAGFLAQVVDCRARALLPGRLVKFPVPLFGIPQEELGPIVEIADASGRRDHDLLASLGSLFVAVESSTIDKLALALIASSFNFLDRICSLSRGALLSLQWIIWASKLHRDTCTKRTK